MAKQHEFTRPQTAGVQMPPETESLFDEPVKETKPPDWLDFPAPPENVARYGEQPYDHAPVLLTPDGALAVEAQWQVSRRVTRARWEAFGFWAARGTGGRAIDFEPIGWREVPK